ncbi:hypothetical protein BpHYR1_021404 [Brachionus plicatilis]|uniref:Uncharacterized protein n=1 Tax=Brachionus plicatilis TaxID=10195 RepID=A0A3M7Q004_BRAPC|nr:hypothetical protein BpHYR1_021404 [Brachionus plicatilis]
MFLYLQKYVVIVLEIFLEAIRSSVRKKKYFFSSSSDRRRSALTAFDQKKTNILKFIQFMSLDYYFWLQKSLKKNLNMQNSIDNISQLLENDQNLLIQTRHKVGDLKALFIEMQANYARFKSDYTALETQHRRHMEEFGTSINPLLADINVNRQRIHEKDAQLRTNKEELEKAKSCSKNCDEEFVRKVMNEINRSLSENRVNVNDFDSEFNRLRSEIDSFKTKDDKIIAEFNTVLTELGKLDPLGVTSPPFEPLDLINDDLNRSSASLERKREILASLNDERANNKTQLINQKRLNHENKTTLFDDILALIRRRSAELANRFVLMIPQLNRINADLDNLNISLGRLPNRINQVRLKVENFLNSHLNESQAEIFGLIFLVGATAL